MLGPAAAGGEWEPHGPSRGHEEQPSGPSGCRDPKSGSWPVTTYVPFGWPSGTYVLLASGQAVSVLFCPAQGTSEWEAECCLGWRVMEGGCCSHGGVRDMEGSRDANSGSSRRCGRCCSVEVFKALQMAEVRNEAGPGISWRRGKGN